MQRQLFCRQVPVVGEEKMAAEPKTGHLRVWTADEIDSKSSVQLEIVLEDIDSLNPGGYMKKY